MSNFKSLKISLVLWNITYVTNWEWAGTSQGMWVTNSTGVAGLTDLQVRAIVDEALAKYDADKTGLVDFALESSGELNIEFVTFVLVCMPYKI
jgi:hypothetical protein